FNSDGMSFSLTFDMRIDVAQSGTYDTLAEEIAVVRFDISGSGEMTATDTPSLDGIIIAGNIASIDVTNPSIEFLKDDLDVSTYFFDDFASILNPLLESVIIPIINKTLESGMEIQLPEGMTADGFVTPFVLFVFDFGLWEYAQLGGVLDSPSARNRSGPIQYQPHNQSSSVRALRGRFYCFFGYGV
ncbi:hypothetical protein ADUPG1_012032, partial [Aduncisulcus paluster]